MKVFLIWPNSDAKAVLKKLEAAGHTVTYWVCGEEDIAEMKGRTDIILHDHYAAWDGKPTPGVPDDVYTPAGIDLIEKFLRTESLTLTMMDKRFDAMSVNERKHMYYDMLGYWNSVLEHYRPDVVIFPVPPHTVYNFILFNLAKDKKIRTLMFENSWITDRALTYSDYEEGSPKLVEALKRNAGKKITLADLSPDLQEYYKAQIERRAVPQYMTTQKREAAGWHGKYRTLVGLGQSIKAGRFIPSVRHFLRKRIGPNLRKDYEKVQQSPDFSVKYVYMPLGTQPERNSSPQGGLFVDQILMAEVISKALPEGWQIYIKEHPSQWWLRLGVAYSGNRYRGYYEKLAAIKNVRIVPIKTNTFELIDHCQAVASYGSTAGWEAALRGKAVLNFGYPWYQNMPEVLQVRDVPSTKAALEKVKNGYKINEEAVFRFLKSYDESSFRGSLEVLLKKDSHLTQEEHTENIANAVLHEVSKM